jgi:hypothetical protein
MAKLAWIRTSLALGALGLLGCNPVGTQAQRVETGFLGMEARTLVRCLGEAHSYEIRDDGSELWAYTAPLTEDADQVEISRSTGPGTAFQRPRVESGSPVERSTYETSNQLEEGRVPPGNCVYLFTLRDGAVGAYRSRGRSHQNMNADAVCSVALKRCVPAVAAAAPASPD